jgi:hypothetical protein
MKTIDMRYKPYFLPQVNAPHEEVMERLQEEGIDCEMVELDPNELKPMQGIVFSDEVNDFDVEEMDPIWLSQDNDVVDGHHRYLKGIMSKKPIKGVRVGLNGKDTARALNKIQDIYDYEKQSGLEEIGLEEVEVQDTLNDANATEPEVSTNEFLATLEAIEMPKGDGCKVIAYRQKPIMENSVIGNFFLLEPHEGFDKYEIEFENLLDTDAIGIQFGEQNPVEALANMWFPNVDFDNLSAPFVHSPTNMRNKAISEKAKEMGFDGIKYGGKMIQGLK